MAEVIEVREPFWLLVPKGSEGANNSQSVLLLGEEWVVDRSHPFPTNKDGIDYVCISYSGGKKLGPHPFDSEVSVSARTIAVLEAAIQAGNPAAIWIDSFSVPPAEPEKAHCLLRLGVIFRWATSVYVVLSESCFSILNEANSSGKISPSLISALEEDEWVSRVWTYQELVNNDNIRFVAESGGTVSSEAEDVLREVGYAISKYQDQNGWSSFEFREKFPRVSSLEDLIVDWKISGYTERTAYRVMASTFGRVSTLGTDHAYAMVGALTSVLHEVPESSPPLPPSEYLIRVCEVKGDYSFIYSKAARSKRKGESWKPQSEDRLEVVLPWHCWGDGQPAQVCDTHIELGQAWLVSSGEMNDEAERFLRKWLKESDRDCLRSEIRGNLFERLCLAGFSGCGASIETEDGIFFSQQEISEKKSFKLAVATGIRMTFGSPGLLLANNGTQLFTCEGVGFFVGRVPKTGVVVTVA